MKTSRGPRGGETVRVLVALGAAVALVLLWLLVFWSGVSQTEVVTATDRGLGPAAETKAVASPTELPHPQPEVQILGPREGARDAAVRELQVLFRLDPRITLGRHMGDRWVDGTRYLRMGTGPTCAVEARTRDVDPAGVLKEVAAGWIVSDPDMVRVSSVSRDEVLITVLRDGESHLRVESGGMVREFTVRASYLRDFLRAEIIPLKTEHADTRSAGAYHNDGYQS